MLQQRLLQVHFCVAVHPAVSFRYTKGGIFSILIDIVKLYLDRSANTHSHYSCMEGYHGALSIRDYFAPLTKILKFTVTNN